MREVVTKVYSFDELSDEAKETAIEKIREWLSNGWDDYDNDAVRETMVYMLAEKFRTPGWDTFGPADFPGIPRVRISGWSLDRDRHLSLLGTLDRGNAPALPWVDGIDSVAVFAVRHGTEVEVIDAVTLLAARNGAEVEVIDADPAATDAERSAMEDAIADAIHAALTAGEEEAEYRTSEECAKERTGDHEYTEEGHLYP